MKKISLLLLMGFFASMSIAQPGNPGGGTDPDVPITGIEILVGMGSILGVSRFLKGRNKSK